MAKSKAHVKILTMSIDRPQFTTTEEMFVRVSMHRPADGTSQAALIALECIEKNLDPILLVQSFDESSTIKMQETAMILHSSKHRHIDVSIDRVRIVILYNFLIAAELIKLGQEACEKVGHSLYNQYYSHMDSGDLYLKMVDDFIGNDTAEKIRSIFGSLTSIIFPENP